MALTVRATQTETRKGRVRAGAALHPSRHILQGVHSPLLALPTYVPAGQVAQRASELPVHDTVVIILNLRLHWTQV